MHTILLLTITCSSGDSDGDSVSQSKALYTSIAKEHPDNIIALNHETYETTVNEVLPYALKTLSNAGYKFVTVAECLGMDPYISEVSPEYLLIRTDTLYT